MLDRFGSRDVLPSIPSNCDHIFACIAAHPGDARFVLEGCQVCRETRNYYIYTRQQRIVHDWFGPIRMCYGPSGCILFQELLSQKVLKLKWKNEQLLKDDEEYTMDGKIWKWCYAEPFNILVTISYDKEIKAVKLENDNPTIWKLCGVVSGQLFEPDAITCNMEGNVYVGDGANNTILKINGLTGDVIGVFLMEEEEKIPIRSLFWSDTEPNLTLIRGDRIITYNI